MKLFSEDLNFIIEETAPFWNSLKGENLLLTGGTGFFGKWLVESFIAAFEAYHLDSKLYLLTRNIPLFIDTMPHLAVHPSIKCIEGDIQFFVLPDEIRFSYVIHGATSACVKLNTENPILMFDTILKGTRRLLDVSHKKNVRKILFLSTGATYGKQPHDISHIDEHYFGRHDIANPQSAYGLGKTSAEFLCTLISHQNHLNITTARCFSFLGPWLPLDIHYAVGNFIKNKIEGQTIRILGDGTPYRSYMYMADLTIWLWTLLFKGKNGVSYNVGSERAVSIYEIAQMVNRSFGPALGIDIKGEIDHSRHPERYIPSTRKIRSELGVRETTSLESSIEKTIRWYKQYMQTTGTH